MTEILEEYCLTESNFSSVKDYADKGTDKQPFLKGKGNVSGVKMRGSISSVKN